MRVETTKKPKPLQIEVHGFCWLLVVKIILLHFSWRTKLQSGIRNFQISIQKILPLLRLFARAHYCNGDWCQFLHLMGKSQILALLSMYLSFSVKLDEFIHRKHIILPS